MKRRRADRPSGSRPRRASWAAEPPRPTGFIAGLQRLFAWLRGIAIALAVISAISFVPVSVTADWPDSAQRAMAITREVRALLVDLGSALMRNGADWAGRAGHWLAEDGGMLLSETAQRVEGLELGVQLPRLGDLLPDPSSLFGDWLGGLIADWWPPPTLPAGGGELPNVAGSFNDAKDLLYRRVERGQRITAYCGCRYSGKRAVDLASCGLADYAGIERARRVEAEHVFPAAQFGHFRRCWRQPEAHRACRATNGEAVSGRECCLRVDETFLVAHNDLQNLIPVVGMINAERRDYRWGMAPDGERYGDCGIRIDAAGRRVQPPDGLRGDIARIMLYMRDTYGFRLSRQDERLFSAWNRLDPPDAWELKRQQRIARLQGMENAYVVEYGRPH